MISTRHVRRGTIGVHYVTTLGDKAAPSVAEISAGVDLTEDCASLFGWTIVRPIVQLRTVDTFGGVLSAPAHLEIEEPPTLTLYDRGSGNAATRTALAAGSQGFVVFTLDDADPVAADRASVWPVVSAGIADRLTSEVEAAQMVASFALWDMPDEEATIA